MTARRPITAGRTRARAATLATMLALAGVTHAGEPPQLTGSDTFATVGDSVVTVEQYVITLRAAVRETYYHGQVPADEMARFQRQVAEDLVDRVLLAAEAARRGIRADPQRSRERLDKIVRRYAGNPDFESNREALLAALEQRLAEKDRIEQLRESVRDLPPPEEDAVRAYFEQHPDKFTEPERARVSAILLRVDPSAPRAAWDAAREEAARLRASLAAGADFADLARLHSADESAARGGDMGYLHRGMLGEPAQAALDALAPGGVSEPVDLLEGIALFRLDERQASRRSDFAAGRARAAELLERELADRAWEDFKRALREATTVSVRQDLFLPVTAAAAPVHGSSGTPSPQRVQ